VTIPMLVLVVFFLVPAAAIVAIFLVSEHQVRRRKERFLEAVDEARGDGWLEGARAGLAGRTVLTNPGEPVEFSPMWSSQRRRKATEDACARAWVVGWIEGHATGMRARRETEIDAVVEVQAPEAIAELEALLNGEARR